MRPAARVVRTLRRRRTSTTKNTREISDESSFASLEAGPSHQAEPAINPDLIQIHTVVYNDNISMASNPTQHPPNFKIEYHPRSKCPSIVQSYEEFGQQHINEMAPNKEPWHLYHTSSDFEFTEIALEAGLSAAQINGLISLLSHVSEGQAKFTFKNEDNLRKAWDNAAAKLTLFSKHDVTALDLLANPLLAPHFVWDAQHLFKHGDIDYECFYTEPWMGNQWWDIQIRLSSHGTVKGYPVVARCPNLPVGICNGEQFRGEPAKEEGKTGYTNFKHFIWHKAFLKLLKQLIVLWKTGYSYECYDKIIHWLFPIILILSTDYEEL
ncbi:hypothetical protein PAXINDRAFT_157319 [Paxillus involutus ATCC 200175]|uniref:Uncharacterized protein n=1 Tax=Paxillus involutus ATCC 200175 TaxID=664439 RepID=A0A0C9SSN8_PAXIN|nr:hypothetical protein PAXINDRAFT_157319 [Paxillus involutus ATCC 200175]